MASSVAAVAVGAKEEIPLTNKQKNSMNALELRIHTGFYGIIVYAVKFVTVASPNRNGVTPMLICGFIPRKE